MQRRQRSTLDHKQNPKSKILKDAVFDTSVNLWISRTLYAIVSFVKDVESLPKVYQTEEPAVPFLADDLLVVIKNCLRRFMKYTLVSSLQTQNLCDLDLKC